MALKHALIRCFFIDATLSTKAEPATKKQKLLSTPPETQDSQESFADVLERIQLDARGSTGAFLAFGRHARSLITRRV